MRTPGLAAAFNTVLRAPSRLSIAAAVSLALAHATHASMLLPALGEKGATKWGTGKEGPANVRLSEGEVKETQFTIPQNQPLGMALRALVSQANTNIMFDEAAVAGKTAVPLQLKGTLNEALQTLLQNTGLEYRFLNEATVVVAPAGSLPPAATTISGTQGADARDLASIRLAQNDPSSGSGGSGGHGDGRDSQASKTDSSESSKQLEEILVTASRREERLQDTSMSVSVLSARDIQQRGLNGMSDYLLSVPGASHIDQGAGRNSTVIRGVAADPQNEGLSNGQTVGVYFGEVPLSGLRWSSVDIKLVDMERVEVLRGPQGTLYGSGSLSGAIRNIPIAPNLADFEGRIEAGYSDTARHGEGSDELKGAVNIPILKDSLAVRAVAYRFADTGFVKNVAGSDPFILATAPVWGAQSLVSSKSRMGDTETTGGRIAALWKPTDELSAKLTYLVQDTRQTGFPEVDIARGSYEQARLQLSDLVGGGSESLRDDDDIANLELNYDFGWAALVSSSSYSEQTFRRYYDLGAFWGDGRPVPQIYTTDARGFSQEARLVSHWNKPLQFIVGLYYEDLSLSEYAHSFFGGDAARNPFGQLSLYESLTDTELRQKAAFGELSYKLTERVEITLGARAFNYDRTNTSHLIGGAFVEVPSTDKFDADESDESYKANATFRTGEKSLLYAQWSQGFRVGRPLPPFPSTCDIDGNGLVDGIATPVPVSGASVRSDSLDNYELGAKFALLDDRATVNASLYQIKWDGLPVEAFGAQSCVVPAYINAGKARSRGVEFESAFRLAANLQVNLGASWGKAKLDGDAPSIGADGDRLPGSPKSQFSVGVQYMLHLAEMPAFVRGDYAYIGTFFNKPGERGLEAGGYGLLSAKVGVTLNQFELSLFGSNLANSDAVAWADSVFPDGRAFRVRPRTIGMNVTVNF